MTSAPQLQIYKERCLPLAFHILAALYYKQSYFCFLFHIRIRLQERRHDVTDSSFFPRHRRLLRPFLQRIPFRWGGDTFCWRFWPAADDTQHARWRGGGRRHQKIKLQPWAFALHLWSSIIQLQHCDCLEYQVITSWSYFCFKSLGQVFVSCHSSLFSEGFAAERQWFRGESRHSRSGKAGKRSLILYSWNGQACCCRCKANIAVLVFCHANDQSATLAYH